MGGYRDCHSYRGPEFGFQYPCGKSQVSVALAPGNLISSSGLQK